MPRRQKSYRSTSLLSLPQPSPCQSSPQQPRVTRNFYKYVKTAVNLFLLFLCFDTSDVKEFYLLLIISQFDGASNSDSVQFNDIQLARTSFEKCVNFIKNVMTHQVVKETIKTSIGLIHRVSGIEPAIFRSFQGHSYSQTMDFDKFMENNMSMIFRMLCWVGCSNIDYCSEVKKMTELLKFNPCESVDELHAVEIPCTYDMPQEDANKIRFYRSVYIHVFMWFFWNKEYHVKLELDALMYELDVPDEQTQNMLVATELMAKHLVDVLKYLVKIAVITNHETQLSEDKTRRAKQILFFAISNSSWNKRNYHDKVFKGHLQNPNDWVFP